MMGALLSGWIWFGLGVITLLAAFVIKDFLEGDE